MEFIQHNRVSIDLHNDEIDTLRDVVRLAHERLMFGPVDVMRGVPLERRAGLIGPELFRVKRMLENLGEYLGNPVSFEEPPAAETTSLPAVIGFAIVHNIGSAPEARTEDA